MQQLHSSIDTMIHLLLELPSVYREGARRTIENQWMSWLGDYCTPNQFSLPTSCRKKTSPLAVAYTHQVSALKWWETMISCTDWSTQQRPAGCNVLPLEYQQQLCVTSHQFAISSVSSTQPWPSTTSSFFVPVQNLLSDIIDSMLLVTA